MIDTWTDFEGVSLGVDETGEDSLGADGYTGADSFGAYEIGEDSFGGEE